MLFHSGIPCPTGDLGNVEEVINDISQFCKRIVVKCKKAGSREKAIERIPEVFPDSSEEDQIRVKESINYFLDKWGPTKYKDIESLAFFDCWDRKKPESWEILSSINLQEIFETRPPLDVTIRGVTLSCERAEIRNPDVIATFAGEEINLSVTYEIPPEEHGKKWNIRLNGARQRISEVVIDDPSLGRKDFSFTVDERLSRSDKNITMRIIMISDEMVHAQRTFNLNVCGEVRPAFTLIKQPVFEIVNGIKHDGDPDADEPIVTDTPVKFYLFTNDENKPVLRDQDNKDYTLIEEKKGIWSSQNRVDPTSDNFSQQLTMTSRFGDLSSAILLKANLVESGEFTLEDELRVFSVNGKKDQIEKILPIFKGTSRKPYLNLGKNNSKSLFLSTFAGKMIDEKGWRPIIGDIGEISGGFNEKNYVVFFGEAENPLFNRIELNAEAQSLIEEYQKIRYEFIQALQNSLDPYDTTNNHPVYASHPIYIEEHANNIEELLVKYLEVYKNILKYVEENKSQLDWSRLFIMVYLDCLIYWSKEDTELSYNFILNGPFHPLILAKRYMVQFALVERAKRLTCNDTVFYKLSVLLKGIKGYSWIPGVKEDGNELEPLYVFPTSDPGWNVAIKKNIGVKIYKVLKILRNQFGMELNINDGRTSELAETSIKSYLRTFPSRRSIGMHISKGYTSSHIVHSMRQLLHNGEETSSMGEKIPGGIRLAFEDDVEQFKDVNMLISPPIMIYDSKQVGENISKIFPDVKMLEPREDIKFRSISGQTMPRGVDKGSVFSEPILKLVEGQTAIPSSYSIEFDTSIENKNELGSAFTNAIAKAFEISGERIGVVCTKDLPDKLEYDWIVAPGSGMDPAIFVKWVRDGANVEENRALWDFKVDIGETKNTYFIVSNIPREFEVNVNGFFEKNVASEFITELGNLGIAIGGEALKSGRNALGAIGIVGTIRLLNYDEGANFKGLFRKDKDSAGFLVPVDSFLPFFGRKSSAGEGLDQDSRRTDLLAIQLMLTGNDEPQLEIFAKGVESKYLSSTFSTNSADEALEQAKASIELFKELIEVSLENGGMPERLGLLNIIKFGLRISSPSTQEKITEWIMFEKRVYQALLRGRYKYKKSKHESLVVSTEKELTGAAEYVVRPNGLWIRINKEHWPGVSETPSIKRIRDNVSNLFDISKNLTSETVDEVGIVPIEHPDSESPPLTSTNSIKEDEKLTKSEEDKDQPNEIGEELSDNNIPPSEVESLSNAGKLKKIFLGTDDSRNSIYLDHESLDNLNIMITGSSGSGKTQLLKYIICKIREQQKNVLILDFKNDFASDSSFVDRSSLENVFVNFDGLPFNPLIPMPKVNPRSGEHVVQIGQHISGLASILKRIYGLGPQQLIAVKNAIEDSFSDMGLQTRGNSIFNQSMNFPDFRNVGEKLEDANPSAFNRLDPLFTLDLFRPESRRNSFKELANRSMVIDLSDIPSEEVRDSIAEIILLSSQNYYQAQPQSGNLRQVIVFDEAHRILDSTYIENSVRECRSWGVGLILSSQFPGDYPRNVSGNMATKILHSNGSETELVNNIKQLIGYRGNEAEILGLERFEAFINNHELPHTKLRTMNYPLHLVHSYLKERGESKSNDFSGIEGIDTKLTTVANLVKQLEKLGLAVENEGGLIRLLDRNNL
ncbi:MAG: type IV secretion system DNA-binding domain-containing protein [Nitrospinota bacterium]|nr:type IV secretion system DNA-binding domain-containing protein [Nitrospinota bacterium]